MMGPELIPWILSGAAALLVLVFGLGLSSDTSPSSGAVNKRLKRGKSGPSDPVMERMKKQQQAANRHVRRNEQMSSISGFDYILRRLFPNPDKLRQRLERTGKAIRIGEFILIVLITALGIGVALRMLWNVEATAAALGGILFALVIPNKVITFMGNRRIKKFMKDFPAAIDMIVRGLRSGLPFVESVAAVGREFPDPVGIEFRRVSDGVKLGQSVENAMWDISSRIDVPEFKFLIVAMTIQRETGGNLAETLGNLAELLRKREALKLKIKALSSEAKASAFIIGSLPFCMFLLLRAVAPDYISLLWTDERGQLWAVCGMCWMSIGAFIMWKMVNFEI